MKREPQEASWPSAVIGLHPSRPRRGLLNSYRVFRGLQPFITGAVSGTVFINGLNAATLDSTGGHGNVVVGGSGTVIIGQSGGGAAFSGLLPMPVHFNDRMKIVDEASGEPLAYLAYVIERADGTLERGVTDAAGHTHTVSSHVKETIKLTRSNDNGRPNCSDTEVFRETARQP